MRFPTMWYVRPAKPPIRLDLSLHLSKRHIVGNHMSLLIIMLLVLRRTVFYVLSSTQNTLKLMSRKVIIILRSKVYLDLCSGTHYIKICYCLDKKSVFF